MSISDECTLDGTDVPFPSCSAECLMEGLLELYMFLDVETHKSGVNEAHCMNAANAPVA